MKYKVTPSNSETFEVEAYDFVWDAGHSQVTFYGHPRSDEPYGRALGVFRNISMIKAEGLVVGGASE